MVHSRVQFVFFQLAGFHTIACDRQKFFILVVLNLKELRGLCPTYLRHRLICILVLHVESKALEHLRVLCKFKSTVSMKTI